MMDAIYQAVVPWIPLATAISIGMALASMVLIPLLLVRMPRDYFVTDTRLLPERGPLGWLVWTMRNGLALVLLVLGIAMLVLPGQGLLTILIAIACSTFPGKYRMERALVRRASIYRAINWIRARYRRPPVIHPDTPVTGHAGGTHD